jgi:hypothetical protein
MLSGWSTSADGNAYLKVLCTLSPHRAQRDTETRIGVAFRLNNLRFRATEGFNVTLDFALAVLRVPLLVRSRFVEESAPGIAVKM